MRALAGMGFEQTIDGDRLVEWFAAAGGGIRDGLGPRDPPGWCPPGRREW